MKVFLDMDGVIADFFGHAVRHSDDSARGWRNMEFRDTEKVLRRIRKTENFFRDLPAFPNANTLVQSIVNISGGCQILSSPLAGYDNCAFEKELWLQNNIRYKMDDVIITSDKTKYAEGNILIDDYGYNCRKWEDAGGYAIKYQADEQHISDVIIALKALFV